MLELFFEYIEGDIDGFMLDVLHPLIHNTNLIKKISRMQMIIINIDIRIACKETITIPVVRVFSYKDN